MIEPPDRDRGSLSGSRSGLSPLARLFGRADLPRRATGVLGRSRHRAFLRAEHRLAAAAGGTAPRRWHSLERSVLAAGGVVLRYGQFYGPGTFHEHAPPDHPRISVEEAADHTVAALDAPSGVLTMVED